MGFVDALRAIWDTGDAAAPLDSRLPPVAKRLLLEALRPTRIVGSDGEQRKLADGLPVEAGDAVVVATSGTSGQPKGVVLTHEAVAASAGGRPPAWPSTPHVTRGSPASPWPTSEGSPW